MTFPLICVTLSGVAYAFLGLCYKLAEARGCRPIPFAMCFTACAGVISFARALSQPTPWGDWKLWTLGVVMGVLVVVVIWLVLLSNRLGPASVTWTVTNLALLVPILLAPFFLNERLTAFDGLLVALFAGMLFLFARGTAEGGEVGTAHLSTFVGALALLFLANGLFMFGNKLMLPLLGASSAGGLAVAFYLTATLLALAIHVAQTGSPRIVRAEAAVGLYAGIASAAGTLLLLAGMALPAAVAFPLSQGISMAGGIILTAAIYRERMPGTKLAGFALAALTFGLALVRVH